MWSKALAKHALSLRCQALNLRRFYRTSIIEAAWLKSQLVCLSRGPGRKELGDKAKLQSDAGAAT